MIAGKGESINTNHIFGKYGVYMCNETLKKAGLMAQGEISYAANHFRAILDRLYRVLRDGRYPSYMQGDSENFLDTREEKEFLLEKSITMLPHLNLKEGELLQRWVEKERLAEFKG
jgi:hypothetical protein